MDTFYNGLTYTTMMTMNAAHKGAHMTKYGDEAYVVIEEMAMNYYQWVDDIVEPPKKGECMMLMH